MTGNIYRWIEDLSQRSQKERVGKVLPAKADIPSGISQGSVMGPILFTIVLLMIYRNVSNAVAKSLLMIPKYMTQLVAVIRYKKTCRLQELSIKISLIVIRKRA